ncbi:hypothetical protein GCM10029976_037120 [Kribbella albertanoniae]|uniref:LppP/LprE family lipoprotein n=1 Tax=Kribbella albertanoniae TaxID=1266829 RepID=A0A4R4PTY3_9ACTN|nr:hypothetical protein [Kribbella albertanoniae]TDC25856.1 hypothetical protein E1261_23480 [Kribbella albertanoniae]
MRMQRLLAPAVAAVVALAVLSGCGNGSGLRVEGAEPAEGGSVSPRVAAPSATTSPSVRSKPVQAAPLTEIRTRLLADRGLDSHSRAILVKCTVISRCLGPGPTVDVMHSGVPQQVVYIHTLEKFVFGAFLMALEPAGPRRIWSLKVDQPTINANPQGDLVVASEIFQPDDKPCCPSEGKVEVYRWDGRQMTKVSSTDQKGD